MVLKYIKPQKPLDELEEETERLEVEDKKAELEYSVAQKRYMRKQLELRGRKVSSFGDTNDSWTWKKIVNWLKTH